MSDHFCRQCGSVLPGGTQFCPKCGTPTSASAPSPPPPVTPKPANWWRRRSGAQKTGLIVGAVIVVLILIGATVGSQATGEKNGSAASTTSSERTEAAAQTVSTQAVSDTFGEPATTVSEEMTTTTEEQATTTTVADRRWSQAAEVGGLRITVDKPFTNNDLQVTYALQVDKTLRVLMVKITIENASDEVADYDRSEFTLYGTHGAGPYPANVIEAKFAPNMPAFEPSGAPAGNFGVDLEPGQTTVGYVAYTVPKTADAARMEYDAFSSLVGAEAFWH